MNTLLPHPSDGCPSCITRRRTVITEPTTVRRDRDCLLAEYQCPRCRHKWPCWWDVESLAAPERRDVA